MRLLLLLLLLFLHDNVHSFAPIVRHNKPFLLVRLNDAANTDKDASTSYEVDEDEDSEQLLNDRPIDTLVEDTAISVRKEEINGASSLTTGRYDEVLFQVGLKNLLKQVSRIPKKHAVSTNDVFCNRELLLSGIRAVGFDMDYTLAQYQQPAFDKLAFDGAKRKLVEALGYPEAVLEFEYNHTKWTRGLIIDTQVCVYINVVLYWCGVLLLLCACLLAGLAFVLYWTRTSLLFSLFITHPTHLATSFF